jgi:hypothetical protein
MSEETSFQSLSNVAEGCRVGKMVEEERMEEDFIDLDEEKS